MGRFLATSWQPALRAHRILIGRGLRSKELSPGAGDCPSARILGCVDGDDDATSDSLDEASSDDYLSVPDGEEGFAVVEEFGEPSAMSDALSDLTDQVRVARGVTERFAMLEMMIDTCIAKLLGVFDTEPQTRFRQFILQTRR